MVNNIKDLNLLKGYYFKVLYPQEFQSKNARHLNFVVFFEIYFSIIL